MYPSKEKSFAGIFVKNQYQALKAKLSDDEIDIFYMKRKFTSKAGSYFKYVGALFGFLKFLFKKYDVVHLHYLYPLIYLAYLYKLIHPKSKLVVTYHGSDVTKKISSSNLSRIIRLLKKVDYHIPVGKALAEIFQSKTGILPNKILPVGVNDTIFFYEDVDKIFDFIYVGSLIHRKGVDLLIDTIPELEPSINVCIVGQGDYIQEVRNLEINHRNLTFYEGLSQEEIQSLIVKSKFLLLPTRNEGFPTSTIESMYCGVPVLVSDIPQTKEQVVEGENGFIIPVNDKDALLRKMIELKSINDAHYNKMVKNTLTYYRDISLTSVCEELVEIYTQLANND